MTVNKFVAISKKREPFSSDDGVNNNKLQEAINNKSVNDLMKDLNSSINRLSESIQSYLTTDDTIDAYDDFIGKCAETICSMQNVFNKRFLTIEDIGYMKTIDVKTALEMIRMNNV